MEKTGILILFLYTCMCIGATTGNRGINKPQSLGENVTVNAFVLYDKSILNKTQAADNDTTPVWSHFTKIFQQVQEAIHKMGAMITMDVKNVTEGHNITVNSTTSPGKLNGTATLAALLEYANSSGINETNYIFYFFVGTDFDVNISQTDALYTKDTFCTENKTAAIVNTIALPGFYLTAKKMTLYALGSNHTGKFSEADKQKLTEVFQRCPNKSTENAQIIKEQK
ncbi:uncharacterized protein LOC142564369 [Dermacentor variabilis]|uniref:uncharacterized protein LOC142564369 n=1 Tax=Dermacentor variabilis TaxID=34621 RepID=UPI003F5C61D5